MSVLYILYVRFSLLSLQFWLTDTLILLAATYKFLFPIYANPSIWVFMSKFVFIMYVKEGSDFELRII